MQNGSEDFSSSGRGCFQGNGNFGHGGNFSVVGFASSHVGGELDGNSRFVNNGSGFGGDESYNDFDSYTINLQILESQRKETWEVEALVLIILEANI